MRNPLLVFLSATSLLTAAGLVRLLMEDAEHFTTGPVSLSRLTPLFLAPALIAFILSRIQKQEFSTWAMNFRDLKNHSLFVWPIVAVIASAYSLSPASTGHFGRLLYFSLLVPLLLAATLAITGAWFGYFISLLNQVRTVHPQRTFLLSYTLWMMTIYFYSSDFSTAQDYFSLLGALVISGLMGSLGFHLRKTHASVWPASALQFTHLLLLFAVFR